MADESSNQQSCSGKKRAMLAYGVIQISATVVSAVSLAAIAFGLCAVSYTHLTLPTNREV